MRAITRSNAVVDAVRSRSVKPIADALAGDATIDIGEDRPAKDAAEEHLRSLLNEFTPAQRAGVSLLGDDARTVVIVPESPGQPGSRTLFLVSHPEGQRITELIVYIDEVTGGNARGEFPASSGAAFALPRPEIVKRSMADERVLVTASTDGLGAAVAQAFVRAGAQVVVHGRRADGAVDRLGATYVAADLSDPAGIDTLAAAAATALGGPVTTLINNLGPWDDTPLSMADYAAWQVSLQANVVAAGRLAALLAPGMRNVGTGRIVNISAVSAFLADNGLYGLAKAAVDSLTAALAVELAPDINVNAVAPGQIQESAAFMDGVEPGAVARMLKMAPSGRFVTRQEIADVVLALCGTPFDMLTGATVPLDGGARLARERRA